jgi:hypothetical protein
MKISLMCNFGTSGGQICDENHIKAGFEALGHSVLDNVVEENTDLILLFKTNKYGTHDIREWRKITKAPIWIWTFDNLDRFPQWYPSIKECNLWLGEELGRKCRFENEELPFYYFPNHAVPSDIFSRVNLAKEYDVVFTGTPYSCQYNPDKDALLKAIDERFNLHIFGNSWWSWEGKGFKNVHKPVFDRELSELYGLLIRQFLTCYGKLSKCGYFVGIEQFVIG